MAFISLNTATALSGLSKRTLWRRVADRNLRTQDAGEPGERTLVALDDLLPLSRLRLNTDDHDLVVEADQGTPEAQCDLALLFLAQGFAAEAVRLLEMAANRFYPEAMHWLGRCHIAGTGVAPDEQLGIGWISKAAQHGHITAKRMMQYLDNPARPRQKPEALEAVLDDIERKVVLSVLRETVHRG
ncbi:MAG: hypothetical protein Q7J47_02835 [Azoarcus sp.]|nr:hypothetical protein [Azoarcus sp.]